MEPVFVTYLGKNGYQGQVEQANKVLTVGQSYEVVGGYIGNSDSRFELKDIRGSFNTVMFDKGWESAEHLMEHCYRKY
jgi:hypothetical protein